MKAETLYIKREVDGKAEYFPSATDAAKVGSYTYDGKRMGGAPTITATIYYPTPLDKVWTKDEYVELNGERYYVTSIPSSSKDNSTLLYKHEVTFTSRREVLDNTLFFDVVSEDSGTQTSDKYRSNQTKFTFGGDIYEFVARINSSLAYCGLYRPSGTDKGYYIVVDDGYGTDEVHEVSFEDEYLTEVLQLINTTYELDYYWVGNVCHVGKVQNDLTATPIKYGRDDALLSVSKENANYKAMDMITGYGSSDNIPYYYPNDDEYGVAVFETENIAKENVSVDLGTLQKKFGASNAYNTKFVLSKISNSEFSESFPFVKNDSAKGQAWNDVSGQYGDSGTFLFSFKLLCVSGCRIGLSGLTLSWDYDGDEGIGCQFGNTRYAMVKNGVTESKSSLDDNYVCDDDGTYEVQIRQDYQFYCGQELPDGVDHLDGTAKMSVTGSVKLTVRDKKGDCVCTEDGKTQIPLADCGITFENTSDDMYATSSYEAYISQEDGIEGGVKLTAISGIEKAAKVTVTGREWVDPSSVLMPSIYRSSKGRERFYYAKDNTHLLPDGSGNYYTFANEYKEGNPHQGSVTYDDIKPTINGIKNSDGELFGEIAGVAFDGNDSDVKDSDGNYIHPYFYIKLHKFSGDYGFSLFDHVLASESVKLNLIKSNGCPACSFEVGCDWDDEKNHCYNNVQTDGNGNLKRYRTDYNDYILPTGQGKNQEYNQDSTKEELWICVKKDSSTLGIVMPNASAGFKPQKGDLFVLTGINPPNVLVTAAEKRLDEALIQYMSENNEDQFNYSIKFSRVFLEEHPDFAKKLNENCKLAVEYDGEVHEVFVSNYTVKVEDDILAEVEVELVNSLEVTESEIKQMIDAVKGETVKSLSSLANSGSSNFNASVADKLYLSKLKDDTAQGVITFLQGLKVGDTGNNEITTEGLARLYAYMTYGFNSGLYGNGASIDHKGNAELNSLFVRQFISTPKFVFNEIAVTKAEQWNTNGYGTIESVDTANQRITLKLEENDYGSLSEGDICRGIFADIDNAYGSDSTTEGELDDSGFVMHKGFFTTYFYVKRVITSEKGKFVFEYGKKSPATPEPCAFMDFAQYGSFTDDQRQSSMYFSSRGRSYIEVLDKVNTWDIKTQNRVCRYGYLGGLALQDKDGKAIYPKGNGIYVQDNIYFGGTVKYLQGLSGLEELEKLQSAYDVSLSQYQSVLTVDDMGNVIGGLYTEDEDKTTKQYKVSTAVFVRKGLDILLEEDDANEDVTEGHYRLHAVSNECSVKIENSTVFVTAIENIKDGVAGTEDDSAFDYDRMRKMTDAMVTLVIDLEGKVSKTVQMPIRIQHDSLPFMVCDLSNESASVAWNTKTNAYLGFPIETKVSLFYQNTPYDISDIDISVPTGLKASMNISGKAKTITVETDGITSDSLPSVMKLPITVVGKYAGASYEYTKELTIAKSADTVVYEVVPSVDSISVDKDGNMSASSVACKVYVTSSDDKRYEITSLPSGFSLKYSYTETPSTAISLGSSVSVDTDKSMVTFGLYDASGTELDKESVPVIKDGKYAPKASSDDDIITVPTDSDGNALDAFSETIALSLMVDGKACTVSSVEISKNGLTNATCTVDGSKATIACAKGAALGKAGQTLVLKVSGTKNDTTYSDYVTVKLVPNVTGEDGDGYEYVYYRSSSSSAPSAPKRSGGTLTSGWYDDPMSPTDSYQYVYVAYKTGEIGSDGTFSTPTLFTRYPKSIDYEITKYYTSSSGTSAPSASTIWNSGTTSMPSDFTDKYPWLWKLTRTFYTEGDPKDTVVCVGYKAADGKGIKYINVFYAINNDRSTAPSSGWYAQTVTPTAENPYLWQWEKYTYTDDTQGEGSKVLIGCYTEGKTGARGPIPRTHTGLTKGDYYMSGADGEAYVDLVYYDNAWYRCKTSHTETATTPSTTYWEQSQTTGWTFMATELLLAKNARIEMMSSQEINLLDSDSNIFGSFRHVSSPTDYALWLGATTGANASFSVTRGGKLKATEAEITGTIKATSGSIGDITIDSSGLNASTWYNDNKVAKSGVLMAHASLWVGYTGTGYKEVAIGKAASIDPITEEWQGACDMDGNRKNAYATNNTMIVRKYSNTKNTGGINFSNTVSDPAWAALNVDTDEGIGIRSIGGNLFGCIAQSVIRTSSVTTTQQTAIDNNRVGILVMINGSETTVKLPKSPITGQMMLIVQGNARVNVDPVGKTIYCGGVIKTTSDKFYSDTVGQFNMFIYDGYYWQLQYVNAKA